MATIEDLPPEILAKILALCSHDDVTKSVQYVCQTWRDVVLSRSFWRHRTFIIENQSLDELTKWLEYSQHIRSIYVSTYADINGRELLNLLREKCQYLQRLSLNSAVEPFSQICCCHYLRDRLLDLSCFTNLTYLNLNLDQVPNHSLEDLFVDYVSCDIPPLLKTCIIQNCGTNGEFAVVILKSCPYLRHLAVGVTGNVMYDATDAATEWYSNIPGEHNLRTLNLEGNPLVCLDILRYIRMSPNLRYVRLRYNNFKDDDVLNFLCSEPRPNLKHLDLSCSRCLSSGTFVAISRVCPNLVSLSLNACMLDMDDFLEIVGNADQLECLSLYDTRIDNSDTMNLLNPDWTFSNMRCSAVLGAYYQCDRSLYCYSFRSRPKLTLYASGRIDTPIYWEFEEHLRKLLGFPNLD